MFKRFLVGAVFWTSAVVAGAVADPFARGALDIAWGAVVRFPGRSFPGSLIQGDSLSIIYQLATAIRGRAKKTGDADLVDDAEELHELLRTRLRIYEETLAAHGIELPYSGPLTTKR